MTESLFELDGGRFIASEHARGPWDPGALHGGAPAALITAAFERQEPGSELQIARLGFEFLRPIPLTPLTLSTRVTRAGRRVQELAAELRAEHVAVCRASALRVREVPADLPVSAQPPQEPSRPSAEPGSSRPAGPPWEARLPAPESGRPMRFALEETGGPTFAGAMEMRWLDDSRLLGPARVWMRLRHPLLPGEPPTPLMRLAACADFGNGVSATLPFERFLFINADLTIHLHRRPRGDWVGLDARTVLHGGGTGLAESVLHDRHGPVGRAFQTLVVQPR